MVLTVFCAVTLCKFSVELELSYPVVTMANFWGNVARKTFALWALRVQYRNLVGTY